jgi:membrane fusion protein, multidrug efflux system
MYFSRLLPLLLASVVICGCQRKAPTPGVKPPQPVTVAKAEAREVPLYLDEIGHCTAFEAVTIRPQVSGAIVGVEFKDGAEVNQGDQLFQVDPRPFRAALDKAKATLAQDRAKAEYAKIQVQRNQDLQQKKVIAPQEYDSLKSVADAAVATVQADEAEVDTAQINLDFCQIRSPIGGRASKRAVDQGNIVISNSTALLIIQRQDPIYVDFTVAEEVLPKVRHYLAKGTLKVQASFANEPAKKRSGQFDFLDNGVQTGTGTVRMRAFLENKDRLFWPGQFVNVRLVLDAIKDAVLIPNEALQVGQDGPFVFVVKADHTVDLRHVKPGQRQEESIVITEGLAAGETVVVTGQIALSPGPSVKIVE